MKVLFLATAFICLLIACNDQKKAEPMAGETPSTPVPSASPNVPVMPELPNTVLYKNWEIGNPAYLKLITDTYQSWDTDMPDDMSKFFTDSAVFDLPNGKRFIPKQNIEAQLRKWRNVYAETENIPFSVVSLHNKDFNQDWVMAMIWNKWKYKDGVKDSMLYFDNWRIVDGKIAHMISMEQKINKQMSRTLNERIPK